MAWLLLVASIAVVWLASLCKIIYVSFSASKDVHFSSGEAFRRRNFLLVIAHPDDESMFFSPTINYLTSRGHNIHVVCLSTGNADGMGDIRRDELYKACAVLKVPLHQVKVLDNPDLQDGFGKTWIRSLIANIIEEEITSLGIDSVITFDSFGVSGHPNHRDVHLGIRKLLCDFRGRDVEAWELLSTNILRKYNGPVDIWLSALLTLYQPEEDLRCIPNAQPLKTFHAMAQHTSQWVWFRKLFTSFSSYTYVNTLRKVKV